jgi:large subunit ribosomal protein L15
VLRNESHPVVSLQAEAELIARSAGGLVPPSLIKSLSDALSSPATPLEVKNEALAAVTRKVGAKFKYRLPDATGRKDIEYYRDPAHRGYLSHTMKQGESPSLFFKTPGAARDRGKQTARRQAAKASADNRLF